MNANISLLFEEIVHLLSHFDGTGDENGSEPKIYPGCMKIYPGCSGCVRHIEWRKNGELHRDGDRPAVIYADGRKEWWVNGRRVR